MRRVIIYSIGTRGDVQPYLALSKSLLAEGVEVALCTHGAFEQFVKDTCPEIKFYALGGNPDALLNSPDAIRSLYRGSSLDQAKFFSSAMDKDLEANWRLFHDAAVEFKPDLLLNTITTLIDSNSVALKLRIPAITCSTIPWYPTTKVPSIMTTRFTSLPFDWMNAASYSAGFKGQWFIFGDRIKKFRKEIGLGPQTSVEYKHLPVLEMYSALVSPPPSDYPSSVKVTGYWTFPRQSEAFQPNATLEQFLSAGDPPIFLGFGSMPMADFDVVLQICRQVCADLNLRAIFYSKTVLGKAYTLPRPEPKGVSAVGTPREKLSLAEKTEKEAPAASDVDTSLDLSFEADVAAAPAPIAPVSDPFLVFDGAPHSWLFPRCSMAVHHGGAGTTAAALEAGIPSVIFPLLGDQPFWAWRVGQLGVGPPSYINLKDLTEANLKSQLSLAMSPAIKQAAAEFGKLMGTQENGCDVALREIKSIFAKTGINPEKMSRLSTHFQWKPDEKSSGCDSSGCSTKFTVLKWRHHCRSCGLIFCQKCVMPCQLPLHYSEPQPTCRSCIAIHFAQDASVPSVERVEQKDDV